jgi:hypothetical protein
MAVEIPGWNYDIVVNTTWFWENFGLEDWRSILVLCVPLKVGGA